MVLGSSRVKVGPAFLFGSRGAFSFVASHLGEVKMRLGQQVWVMFGHEANDLVKHLVLLVHGDGEVDLLHSRQQPENRRFL